MDSENDRQEEYMARGQLSLGQAERYHRRSTHDLQTINAMTDTSGPSYNTSYSKSPSASTGESHLQNATVRSNIRDRRD